MIRLGERLGEWARTKVNDQANDWGNDQVNDQVNDWVIMVNDWVNDGLMMGYGFLKLIFFYVPLVYDQQYLYQVIEHDLLYLLLPCTLPATDFICRNLLLKNISKFTYTMYFCIQKVQYNIYMTILTNN